MIRIPKEPWWAKTGPLLIVFCVSAIIILAIGGWFFFSWLLTSDYQQRLADTKVNITTSMNKAKGNAAGLGTTELMVQFGRELSAETEKFPAPPDLLGLRLIDDQQRLTAEALRTNLVEASGVVNKTAQILEYEQFVNDNLVELNRLKMSTPKELQTAEDNWRNFVNQLAAKSPPYDLQNAHAEIVNLMIAINRAIGQLKGAHGQGPFALLPAQNQLQASMSALQGVFKLFERLNKQQDQALAESYKNLQIALD